MKVSEQIAIIKAYQDGKTIERRAFFTSAWKSIDNIENYQFNFSEYEYRIKQVPKYRPYESVDEAFNEAKKHGFWVRNVDRMYLRFIYCFNATKNRGIYLGDYSADDILDMFVWNDDGSPCGVKIK